MSFKINYGNRIWLITTECILSVILLIYAIVLLAKHEPPNVITYIFAVIGCCLLMIIIINLLINICELMSNNNAQINHEYSNDSIQKIIIDLLKYATLILSFVFANYIIMDEKYYIIWLSIIMAYCVLSGFSIKSYERNLLPN
jgi:hypothetical protein